VLGAQRQGDQYGVLLAGAYSLTSDSKITYEDAKKWIETKDWSEELALSAHRDELNLFGYIMEQIVEVPTGSHGRQQRTVGELILTSAGLRTDGVVRPNDAEEHLRRIGLRVEDNEILISNGRGKSWINNIMEGTDWAKGHAEALRRIDGAQTHPGKSFAGITMRSVGVPLEVLTGKRDVVEEELGF
jgi:putative DNA primase/helicase